MLVEDRSPSHGDLVADLRLVRVKGLGYLRRYSTPALTVACQLYGASVDDRHWPAAVEALLREAVKQVGGGRPGEAASYSFGLVQGTRLWNATARRKAAAKAQGVSVERFRKGYEGVLVEQVAEGVLALLYESEKKQPRRNLPQTFDSVVYDQSTHASLGRVAAEDLVVQHRLADKLNEAGVIGFHLSRADYSQTLAQFLGQAHISILIVSMSLKTKGAENEILNVFEQCPSRSPQFRVIVLLVKPESLACQAASVILGIPYEVFCSEVESMLFDLADFRGSLPSQQASRLYLLQHAVIPSFSGILIDDGLPSARLQIETKLYGAPRSDSYGFTLRPDGQFYERHRRAYYRIIRDAHAFPESGEKPDLPSNY